MTNTSDQAASEREKTLCNYCLQETPSVEGDCTECGFSKPHTMTDDTKPESASERPRFDSREDMFEECCNGSWSAARLADYCQNKVNEAYDRQEKTISELKLALEKIADHHPACDCMDSGAIARETLARNEP